MQRQSASLIFANTSVRLIVVQTEMRRHGCNRSSRYWLATLTPFALVICRDANVVAMNMANQLVDVAELVAQTPGLEALLAGS